MKSQERPQPIDAAFVPRYSGATSFMRLPMVANAANLDVALVGVPFDGATTNRPGARSGPREMRNQSTLIRRTHHVTRVSPYDLIAVADLGDAPTNPFSISESLQMIERFVADIKGYGAIPIVAGGDHLITLPVLRALASERKVGMVHFDAHSDTNDTYFGSNRYTHGTPFRRAIEEGLIDPKRTIQIGIRGSSYDRDEHKWASDQGVTIRYIEDVVDMGLERVMDEAREIAGGDASYISFDIDCVDPSMAPGTGTPEIGGLTTREVQYMLRRLRGLQVIGADVVEVAPPYDQNGMTALVGATMMFELLCVIADGYATADGTPAHQTV